MIEFKNAKDGRYYFNLKANNHEVVQTSQMYGNKDNAKIGAEVTLKVTGEYWAKAFATLLEEKAQMDGEEGKVFGIPEAVKLLMSLKNEDLQKILDRIPY